MPKAQNKTRSDRGLTSLLARYAKDRSGNFAVIAALTFLPITIGALGAVDLATAVRARSELQSAADAAALAAASLSNHTMAQREAEAHRVFAANLTTVPNTLRGTLTRQDREYTYSPRYQSPTTILKLAGIEKVALNVSATAADIQQDLDVVFVLDTSGSMGSGGRMTELKKAVGIFLANFDSSVGGTMAAVVPFNDQVRVDQSVLTDVNSASPPNPYHRTVDCSTIADPTDRRACDAWPRSDVWADCDKIGNGRRSNVHRGLCQAKRPGFRFESSGAYHISRGEAFAYTAVIQNGRDRIYRRDEGTCSYYRPNDVCDGFASHSASGLIYDQPSPPSGPPAWVPLPANQYLLSSGETWSGCVVDRTQDYDTMATAPTTTNPATLYPKARCSDPNLARIRPLTEDLAAIQQHVNTMQPAGATNLTIGLQWGMEMFTPSQPMTGGRPEAHKIMIVLSDGVNTRNRWVGTGSVGQSAATINQINARTELACGHAKAMDAEIYTINLIDGDPAILQRCATSADHFFDVDSASALTGTFAEIASRIKLVRLTM